MTTPNPIVLPTSPEVREKATTMGAVLKYEPGDFPIEQWEYEGFLVTVSEAGNAEITVSGFDAEADARKLLTLLSILGIYQTPPPGFRLVPEEAVEKASRSLRDAADYLETERPMAANLWRSHAAALSPKEAEKNG